MEPKVGDLVVINDTAFDYVGQRGRIEEIKEDRLPMGTKSYYVRFGLGRKDWDEFFIGEFDVVE